MGVEVEGHINPGFGVEEIVDFLKAKGYEGVRWEATNIAPDYFHIYFINEDEPRKLNVHIRQGVFNSNLIKLNKHGNAEKIIRAIVDQFSGIFVPNDCEDHAEIVHGGYHEEEAPYVLKWALANDIVRDSSPESACKAYDEFDKKIRKN